MYTLLKSETAFIAFLKTRIRIFRRQHKKHYFNKPPQVYPSPQKCAHTHTHTKHKQITKMFTYAK